MNRLIRTLVTTLATVTAVAASAGAASADVTTCYATADETPAPLNCETSGALFLQAVTINGGDAGDVRFDAPTGSAYFEEAADGDHVDETFHGIRFDGDLWSADGLKAAVGSVVIRPSDGWVTVGTQGWSFTDPVMLAQVGTSNGGDPITAVASADASTGTYRVRVYEPSDWDGAHLDETVHYVIVERGTHVLASGQVLMAGTVTGVGWSDLNTVNLPETIIGQRRVVASALSSGQYEVPRVKLVNSGDSTVGFQTQLVTTKADPSDAMGDVAWIAMGTPVVDADVKLPGANAGLSFDDPSSIVCTSGTCSYEGSLSIPVGGSSIDLIGASITYTVNASGELATLNGTLSAVPVASNAGFLSELGEMTGSLATVQIGYDYPDTMQETMDLPLDPATRYIFFNLAIGNPQFGPVAIDVPVSGTFVFCLDHTDPALFMATDALSIAGVNFEALGFSAHGNIAWTPIQTWGITNDGLSSFDGELYAAGSIGEEWESGDVTLELTLSGDMTMDIDTAAFQDPSLTDPMDFVDQLGANASLDLSATWNNLGIEANLGAASVRIDKRDIANPSVTLSAFMSTNAGDDFGLLDGILAVQGSAYLAMHLGGSDSHIDLDADLKLANFLKVNAVLHADQSGLIFAGDATFDGIQVTVDGTANGQSIDVDAALKVGGVNFALTGTATKNDLDLEGSVSASTGKIDAGLIKGKLNATVTASIDTSSTSLGLKAKAQACTKNAGGNWHCDSVGATIEVGSSSLKVCGKIPGIGKKCAKF